MFDNSIHRGWNEVVHRLRHFVANHAPAADVDDVMQEALLAIQQGLPKVRDTDKLGPWMYRVTRNAIIDRLRARARAEKKHASFAHEPRELDAEGDDDLSQTLAACVTSFVTQLPSPYREAVTLTELQGLSQKEAAEILGISYSGMKSRVQRGRERLRQKFDSSCQMTLDVRGHVMGCHALQQCSKTDGACQSQESDLHSNALTWNRTEFE